MAPPLTLTKVGAVHAHATIALTVRANQNCANEGIPFTFQQMPSIDYSNGPKDIAIDGNQIAKVTRAIADSDPKWSAEMSFIEYQSLVAFMGAGHLTMLCDIKVTWQVPGYTAFNDDIEGCFIGDGLSSKVGDGTKCKVGSGATMVKPNGIDPFNTGAA